MVENATIKMGSSSITFNLDIETTEFSRFYHKLNYF